MNSYFHRADLAKCRALTLLKKKGGLMNFLSESYPDYQWDQEKFSNKQKKSLLNGGCIILSNKFLHQILKLLRSMFTHRLNLEQVVIGGPIILDIFVPSLNLAVEYHGHEHYQDHYMFGEYNLRKERDNDRHQACKSVGITNINIPYWWKHDKESIVALLHRYRPDIVVDTHTTPFSYDHRKKQGNKTPLMRY